MNTAKYYIEKYKMEKIYEGGWCSLIQVGDINIENSLIPDFDGNRKNFSMIYYLLEKDDVSIWHKLKSAETWMHIDGGEMEISLGGLETKPKLEKSLVLSKNENLYITVPRNTWQTAKIVKGDYVLVTCIVSPSYDDRDLYFEKGAYIELL